MRLEKVELYPVAGGEELRCLALRPAYWVRVGGGSGHWRGEDERVKVKSGFESAGIKVFSCCLS